jgi:hypothetical protein
MVFLPSPALRKIRQLVRRIRRHPDLPKQARMAPCRTRELPDPAQFIDTSVARASRAEPGTRRKRSHSPDKAGE